MSESFKKIKRKQLLKAFAFGGAAGVCCALLAAGIVLLSLKLSGVQIHFAYYILIGAVSAAGAGVPVFLALRPSDKKTAKRLDEEFALNEKVQTMIAYRDSQTDMARLQREDAERRLSGLPKRKIGWEKIVRCCIAPVAALAVFIPAVALPSDFIPADGNGNDDYAVSQYQLLSLKQLIGEVKKSSMREGVKTSAAQSLQTLYDEVSQTDSKVYMHTVVTNTVSAVNTAVGTVYTYAEISSQLNKQEKSKALAQMTAEAITAYRVGGLSISSYDRVEQIAAQLESTVGARLEHRITALRGAFALSQAEGLGEAVSAHVQAIQTALALYTGNTEDALYLSYSAFAETLSGLSGMIAGGAYKDELLQQRLDGAFETLKRGMTSAITEQAYHRMMNEFVRNRLWEIFEMPQQDLPPLSDDEDLREVQGGSGNGSGSGDSENEDDNNGSGGYGDGDDLFGSNDKIFDPATGEIVDYGGLLQSEYYAKMKDLLNNGDLPDDLKQAIQTYFDLLLGKKNPQSGEN